MPTAQHPSLLCLHQRLGPAPAPSGHSGFNPQISMLITSFCYNYFLTNSENSDVTANSNRNGMSATRQHCVRDLPVLSPFIWTTSWGTGTLVPLYRQRHRLQEARVCPGPELREAHQAARPGSKGRSRAPHTWTSPAPALQEDTPPPASLSCSQQGDFISRARKVLETQSQVERGCT